MFSFSAQSVAAAGAGGESGEGVRHNIKERRTGRQKKKPPASQVKLRRQVRKLLAADPLQREPS